MRYHTFPELLSELELWQGFNAQVWDFTVGHGALRIRLVKPSQECVMLLLKDCNRVSFETEWKRTKLVVRQTEGQYGARFIVEDPARLHVECGAVYLSETLSDYSQIPRTWTDD